MASAFCFRCHCCFGGACSLAARLRPTSGRWWSAERSTRTVCVRVSGISSEEASRGKDGDGAVRAHGWVYARGAPSLRRVMTTSPCFARKVRCTWWRSFSEEVCVAVGRKRAGADGGSSAEVAASSRRASREMSRWRTSLRRAARRAASSARGNLPAKWLMRSDEGGLLMMVAMAGRRQIGWIVSRVSRIRAWRPTSRTRSLEDERASTPVSIASCARAAKADRRGSRERRRKRACASQSDGRSSSWLGERMAAEKTPASAARSSVAGLTTLDGVERRRFGSWCCAGGGRAVGGVRGRFGGDTLDLVLRVLAVLGRSFMGFLVDAVVGWFASALSGSEPSAERRDTLAREVGIEEPFEFLVAKAEAGLGKRKEKESKTTTCSWRRHGSVTYASASPMALPQGGVLTLFGRSSLTEGPASFQAYRSSRAPTSHSWRCPL